MPRRLPLVNKLPPHLGDGLLIIALANIGVFVVFFIGFFVIRSAAFEVLYGRWLALSLPALLSGRLWTLFTYGFLHDMDSPAHIVLNMAGLYFLGPHIERRFGRRGFLRFWAVTVVGGGVVASLAEVVSGGHGVIVGASAGVVALVGAWSWIYPDVELRLMFVFPVRARWLVHIVVGIDIFFGLTGSDVAIWAHFGGLAAAWLLIHGWLRPDHLRRRLRTWRLRRRKRELEGRRRRFKVIDGGGDDDGPMIHRGGVGSPARRTEDRCPAVSATG